MGEAEGTAADAWDHIDRMSWAEKEDTTPEEEDTRPRLGRVMVGAVINRAHSSKSACLKTLTEDQKKRYEQNGWKREAQSFAVWEVYSNETSKSDDAWTQAYFHANENMKTLSTKTSVLDSPAK